MDFLSLDFEAELKSPEKSRAYDDVETRKLLRRSLMSAETFDEALEFGFASHEPTSPLPATTTDNRQPPFGNKEYGSEEEDDDDDYASTTDATEPRTPSPTFHAVTTNARQTSFDSSYRTFSKGSSSSSTPIGRPSTSISNREMTIHMSLTRRDLRTPEEELYSTQRRETSGVEVETQDPLALQSLPVCDDPTGAHGAFALPDQSSKGLKKVWKTLRKH
jgi:hypothetical protein